ncbi:MFS transporter [Pectinatus cerevisiiphilus]|uniref:ACS family glucarate transporter-like MFS transporter n=1 Tax=Pectinatus cerevisiiphilus TaxID=86956 RepID=A0A4R3KB12_9FIRM|nr:MFS transporter [Pectinatus cerevisiiphilus]TCS80119.1 ACS family glucarate transporter-like MFS transporter [Pectinatus cerevisiiphilus]
MNTIKKYHFRYVIAVMMLVTIIINYLDRTIMSTAAPEIMSDLNITPAEMGLVMSSFFITYAIMQIPSGWIGDKIGQKICVGVSIVWWSISTIAIACARSITGLIGARLFMGFGESAVYPCNAGITAKWFPDHERGKVTALYDSGSKFGTAFAMPLVAWFVMNYGWHMPFIIIGGIGIIWAIIWFFVYTDPERSKFINAAELKYIREHQAKKEGVDKSKPIKWYKLFKYRNVQSMCFGLFCYNYAMYFFVTWFPTYLVHDRGMQMMTMGWAAMVPPICGIIGQYIGGWFTDYYYAKYNNLTLSRKISIVVGMLLGALIVFASFIENNYLCIVLLCVCYAGMAGASSSQWSLPGDVAPRNMTSVLGGMQNCISNIGGFLSPIITGVIIGQYGNFSLALAICGGMCFIGALTYGCGLKEVKPISIMPKEL